MATIYKCDRCKKEINEFVKLELQYFKTTQTRSYDLCRQCCDEFVIFLGEGELYESIMGATKT